MLRKYICSHLGSGGDSPPFQSMLGGGGYILISAHGDPCLHEVIMEVQNTHSSGHLSYVNGELN